MQQRLHAVVHGHVQGVSFRYYTVFTARQLNLTGWVRNKPDSTVETIAEGERDQLDELIKFLHTGSPSADVTQVATRFDTATGEFDDFTIR